MHFDVCRRKYPARSESCMINSRGRTQFSFIIQPCSIYPRVQLVVVLAAVAPRVQLRGRPATFPLTHTHTHTRVHAALAYREVHLRCTLHRRPGGETPHHRMRHYGTCIPQGESFFISSLHPLPRRGTVQRIKCELRPAMQPAAHLAINTWMRRQRTHIIMHPSRQGVCVCDAA